MVIIAWPLHKPATRAAALTKSDSPSWPCAAWVGEKLVACSSMPRTARRVDAERMLET